MMPVSADISAEVRIAVSQRYKDFVVRRQYRWFGFILAGALGGINAVYYVLCIAFRWQWQFHFQADIMVLPIIGLIAYVIEVRKPWNYELNQRRIKLFIINPTSRLANLKELGWTRTQIVGIEHGEWQGLPSLKLNVLPDFGYTYLLVYNHADEEEVRTKVVPLIEKYRHQYRQELWAYKLRS